jgi:hypothetical protein
MHGTERVSPAIWYHDRLVVSSHTQRRPLLGRSPISPPRSSSIYYYYYYYEESERSSPLEHHDIDQHPSEYCACSCRKNTCIPRISLPTKPRVRREPEEHWRPRPWCNVEPITVRQRHILHRTLLYHAHRQTLARKRVVDCGICSPNDSNPCLNQAPHNNNNNNNNNKREKRTFYFCLCTCVFGLMVASCLHECSHASYSSIVRPC